MDRHGNASIDSNRVEKDMVDARNRRNGKAIKVLMVIVGLFFVMWTPYIVVRLVRYSGVEVAKVIWRLSQAAMFLSTCVNFVTYMSMNKQIRDTVKSFFRCRR